MKYKKEIKLANGKTCILRNAEAEDAKEVLLHIKKTASETEYMTSYPDEIMITKEEEQNYLTYIENNDRAILLVSEIENKIVSLASIMPVEEKEKCRHRGGLGISIQKEYWGMGIGTAAMRVLLEMAERAAYEQVELEVVSENKRAIALYQKFGFESYGIQKHAFKCRDGKYLDFELMVRGV